MVGSWRIASGAAGSCMHCRWKQTRSQLTCSRQQVQQRQGLIERHIHVSCSTHGKNQRQGLNMRDGPMCLHGCTKLGHCVLYLTYTEPFPLSHRAMVIQMFAVIETYLMRSGGSVGLPLRFCVQPLLFFCAQGSIKVDGEVSFAVWAFRARPSLL